MLRDFWALSIFSYVILASAVQGLEQCRKIMYTLAAATIFIEVFTWIIGRAEGGRIAMRGGILANANYLALMLVMGLPFCLFVVRTKTGFSPLKMVSLLMLFTIPVTIAATGSRGGLVTLGVMFVLFFIPLPSSQKVAVGVAALILSVVAIAWSTRSALDRFKVIFSSGTPVQLSDSERSAVESMDLRRTLLLSSLQLTLRHPLLGVGPGMFSVANANFIEETTGHSDFDAWHETHNTFTQLSCESGLPGLFLYCLALLLCFKSLYTVSKLARGDPERSTARHLAFALRLALIAFTGTAIFASNAYAYYFPMLAGLCVAVERACKEQFASSVAAGAPSVPQLAPQVGWVQPRFQPGVAGGSKAIAWKRPPGGVPRSGDAAR
jgi:O-antigen ligase